MKTANKLFSRAGLVLAALVLLPSCGGGEDDFGSLKVVSDADPGAAQRPQVTFTITSEGVVVGDLVITLVPELAPKTVENFLSYVNNGFYVGTIIHRHDPGFVLQGGGYSSPVGAADEPTHKPVNASIPLELKVSNRLGTVAMARSSALNSATSEFFINLANNSDLDYYAGGYAAFGYITNLTLVQTLTNAPCVNSVLTAGLGCLPVPNLVIAAAAQTR